MMEIPSTDWREKAWGLDEALDAAPFDANWAALPGRVRHGFTHFRLEMTILTGVVGYVIDDAGDGAAANQGVWSPPSGFSAHALSVLTRKIADHALQWGNGKGESKPREQR